MSLEALKNTAYASELEDELRNLFVKMYADHLQATADEINVYGAPHLGSLALVQRNVAADGVSIMSQADDVRTRYLHKAWRFRNPERGMHFLRTYLSAIFPGQHTINQLWQKKGEAYPTALSEKTKAVSESSHWLTSRIQVDLDIEESLPARILNSIKTAVAARFVVKVRVAKFCESPVGVAMVMRPAVIMRLAGESLPAPNQTFGIAQAISGVTLCYTESETRIPARRVTGDGNVRVTNSGATRTVLV
jgi:RNA-binding protein YhbY